MSIEIMSAVWRHSSQKGSALLLLLSLADYADERGVSYPSIGALARKTRMTARNVQKLLRQLETDGDLVIEPNNGPNGANRYRLIINGGGENFSPPKRPNRGDGGERGDRGGVNAGSPDPSVDPSIDPSLDPSDDDDDGTQKSSPPIMATRGTSRSTKQHPHRVVDARPTPPVATSPPPDPAHLAAVAQVLVERSIAGTATQAEHDAAQLLTEYPPDWIVRAAIQTTERSDVVNPYAYMVRTLKNWKREDGPRPARADPPEDSEEARRRKYIPDEYSDVIIG